MICEYTAMSMDLKSPNTALCIESIKSTQLKSRWDYVDSRLNSLIMCLFCLEVKLLAGHEVIKWLRYNIGIASVSCNVVLLSTLADRMFDRFCTVNR